MTEDRYLPVAFDPISGSHRMAGWVLYPDEDQPSFSCPAKHIAGIAQHLAPKPHEAVMVLTIRSVAPGDMPQEPPPQPKLTVVK